MKKIFTLLFATVLSVSMFGQEEYTVAWLNAPEDGKPASVDIVGSFNEEGSPVELLLNGWYFIEVEATADDTFKFCDAANHNKVLCQKIDNQWVQAVFKFGEIWETSSYKGVPCKSLDELDLSDAQKYAWKENMPDISGISSTKAAAVKSSWCDLNGRRLNGKPLKKGVYIKNGKKIVIK